MSPKFCIHQRILKKNKQTNKQTIISEGSCYTEI